MRNSLLVVYPHVEILCRFIVKHPRLVTTHGMPPVRSPSSPLPLLPFPSTAQDEGPLPWGCEHRHAGGGHSALEFSKEKTKKHFSFLVRLGFKLRALWLQSRCSTTSATPPVQLWLFWKWVLSNYLPKLASTVTLPSS
jgi:hypothetical protein